ncbi:CPBP family intramembrane metalloprotease [Anaerobacillus sp. CMMVII]|uniref:CPBP family intramembrane glutamic endopeptidase n=1 Tax=Anaerobacillus sp. CMMVII TaxID=2755588 RepID=UPI0021B71C16|nr:type II CAAX endopeptidase family protein [Anaerobacillus sp. CMMVII]MCT8138849.1 CPBP family intramembrane metalloprotease [Anaerobacillus sp. CMMVII]
MRQADLIKKMTDREILLNLYITQLFMLVVALVVGWYLFESWSDFFRLFKWDPFYIFVLGGGSAVLIILFEMVLEKYLPKSMLDDGGINERVFQNRSVLHIILLVTVIAFAEEILFRGVLQTHFGIIPASILFAFIHVRYLSKIVLFVITVCLSFYLGWLYLITENLLVPIFTHFTIDLVLGCILRFRKRKNQV